MDQFFMKDFALEGQAMNNMTIHKMQLETTQQQQ
jgi:hypothetical protein